MIPIIIFLYLLSNLFFTFAIKNIMDVFFGKRKKSTRAGTFSYIFYLLLASAERLLFNGALTHMVIILPTIYFISLHYKSSIPKRLVATITNYVLFSVIAIFTATLMDILPVSLTFYINPYLIGQYMSASLISYLVSLLSKRFINIKNSTITVPFFWISSLSVLIPAIPLTVLYTINLPPVAELSIIFFLAGIILFVFYLYDTLSAAYDNNLKSALTVQEKEYYLSQCRLMQESLEMMKSYRHDMKLHLAVLKDYTSDNKIAVDYLNQLIGNIEYSNIYSETGNIAFDSIVNYKLKNVAADNIKVDVTMFVPPVINIEVADIVTILGNLLDNALEAVAKIEDKMIKINIESSKGNLIIMIDNTFDGEVNYSEGKSGTENVIVTRKETGEHGHGINNIRKSASKYNGHVDISHKGNIFSVGVLLYERADKG